MKGQSVFSILLIVISTACVDPIHFDIGTATSTIAVDGSITDQPGPYTVLLNRAFDIQSKLSPRVALSAKHVTIADNVGNLEVLTQVNEGIYKTSETGIRGTVGRVYTLRIELLDGRIYESIPDTLVAGGQIESLYHNFREEKTQDGQVNYGFDVTFRSSPGEWRYFLWNFKGTFQSETNPELRPIDKGGCEMLNGKCNWLPPCSGMLNIATPQFPPSFERIKPCECCTCWYDIFNDTPIVSDGQIVSGGYFSPITAIRIPLNPWIFQHKIRTEINQLSISRQAFDFWKAVKAQRRAVNSLFQPISGKIKSNFIQISGTEAPIEGIFFASSVSTKSIYITRTDIPSETLIPRAPIYAESCMFLFPNSTTAKPSFWE